MDSTSNQRNPSSQRIFKYDVFMSFRGEDVRNDFADHLYDHLTRKGIFTFRDDKRLQKGEDLPVQLVKAIQDSRVSIIVFSKDYGGSSWCLKEMDTIVDCNKQYEQIVFPLFHDVDPSKVRNHDKDDWVYKEAFVEYEKKYPREVTDRWKEDMRLLGEKIGWDLRNKSEVEEIRNIVQVLIQVLGHQFSFDKDELVGLHSPNRLPKLESLLKLSSTGEDDRRVLGIWGMSGIGKTVLAKVLYHRISYQFKEGCCFVVDVSKSYKDGGAIALQKEILSQILEEQNLESFDFLKTGGTVKHRLSRKKVLIVFDNVDELEQLVIKPEELGKGSRIIIATRDKRILTLYGAHEVYEVPLLTDDEAHQLLCRKAFKGGPRPSYNELIREALEYADHLPLAVRELGKLLYERNAIQWRGALDRMQEDPEGSIMNELEKSIGKLGRTEREIFLDSACFFIGKGKSYVQRILDCCELHSGIGIATLEDQSLITIENQEIHMHKLLQELGKKIVRGKFHDCPEKWNRLWRYEDFRYVMKIKPREIHVEALVLDQGDGVEEGTRLKAEEFSKMEHLRLLILYHYNFSRELNFLSNRLQYLFWHRYPFDYLPSSFQPQKLVELNLPCSRIKRVREDNMEPLMFPKLRRVDLSDSNHLVAVPNFISYPEIITTGCRRLAGPSIN